MKPHRSFPHPCLLTAPCFFAASLLRSFGVGAGARKLEGGWRKGENLISDLWREERGLQDGYAQVREEIVLRDMCCAKLGRVFVISSGVSG